ncbi:hypothetical protein SLEP1_g29495 [Rubroshorea leprosula]|uniref:BHLH domain-containing protein n=1 Tax=Rubroshorea leprosula TaxID=152421 RepID=A0AAV5K447_9ROSI|nr:hypothetical protein SLEP1_g29495 [Rubroshorea leprosula]
MEFSAITMEELCMSGEGEGGRRMGRKRPVYDENKQYKSKNLNAERRRREKLGNRLLTLRSLMNKATIIDDAITYIKSLQNTSKVLSDQLLEMEGFPEEEEKPIKSEIDAAEEMKKHGIQEEVEVSNIDGEKLLIKIVIEKKCGRFTKLMEAMSYLGFELSETSVTTFSGAMLVTSCIQGTYGDKLTVQETQDLLLEIIRGI